MDFQEFTALKSKFVAREVGNELILVPITSNVAQMTELFTLNVTGKMLWDNIGMAESLQEFEALMLNAFEVDKETAQKDIKAFFMQLETLFAPATA